jgi:hypothetical protein
VLEAFRTAGAVLCIRVPKCKQHEVKRNSNGGSAVDWLDLQKPILHPALSLFCPTRTLAFCMAASWFARGAVSGRLLGVRHFKTAKAAPKRYQQHDFQHVQQASNCWKVPTAGDIQSMLPTRYLLHQKQQMAGSSSDSASSSSESSDADSESDSSGAADESRSSRGGSWECRVAAGKVAVAVHWQALPVVLQASQSFGSLTLSLGSLSRVLLLVLCSNCGC